MQVMNYQLKTNDLVGYKNRKIIQGKDFLSFSLDSLLLANLVSINKNTTKILDLGVGIAPIPLILSLRTTAHIDGVEIQKVVSTIAEDNIKLNKLESQVKIYNEDMRDYATKMNTDSYDLIVCNPPFFEVFSEEKVSKINSKKISRHEDSITLEEVFKISKKLLKNKGRFAMIFRTERLVEVISLYEKYNIEPKRLRFVHHRIDKSPKLFFIEGSKNGQKGLEVESPFILYNGDKETEEYNKIMSEVN